MKNKISIIALTLLSIYPQLSNAKNNDKEILTICRPNSQENYVGKIKCQIIGEEQPIVLKEYIKKDKHNDRLKNRKKFEKHTKYKDDDDWYQTFKNELENQYNTSYTFDLTYMPQRGTPGSHKTSQQVIWSPYLSITPLKDTFLGTGQLQFTYTGIQYWGEQAEKLQNKIDVGSGINDYTSKEHQFSQLTYTHTLPDDMKWLSITVGQYSLYFIDGTAQDFNQQTGFISYSLSQNGSASYPTASLGAYLQITPNEQWMMQVGFQDANNVSGSRLRFKSLDDGEYTSYMYLSWNPSFFNTWKGQYMILSYDQPSTKNQPGDSKGWSFSFSQYFGETFNIFGRINGSSGNVVPIKKSIVAGFGFTDPFKRNPNDYLGLAFSTNSMSKQALGQSSIHKYENVFEAQYVIGLGKHFTITPDIQFFINPALDTSQSTATVFSLRLGMVI